MRQVFLKRIEDQILRAPEMSLVAEAFFAPGRAQRSLVELLADRRGFGVRYIWCSAPRGECLRRLAQDTNEAALSSSHCQARLAYLQSAQDVYFRPRDLEGEGPPHLVPGRPCAGCGQQPYEPASCSCCGSRLTEAPVCVCCAHAGRGGTAARAAAAACRCAGCEEDLAEEEAEAEAAGVGAVAATAGGAAAVVQRVAVA
ncbi:hypothetical protein CHLRE_11g467792v5 [Chlamydomonas reinhardtii]|uniref:Uncharacterized protein n=1 Tax=Chlamydomonas reinhardtii TaxID=3055 RepID=A0A2K3D816_CHLRE|nr:uncharacterized protein CHLRE_11g467792v5 [Chlamydomonas reinhardtii]PNW76673.1 hypothetical protein CHLRE_11g467792v5 [Chlamydomonas reinhardtii]